VMKSEAGVNEANKLVYLHNRRMAKIVALMVLGEDYVMMIQQGNRIRYKNDDKSLDELTDIFSHHIKPSILTQLVTMVNAMSNMGDFMHSIRLMSASRTTMPIRIEDEKG